MFKAASSGHSLTVACSIRGHSKLLISANCRSNKETNGFPLLRIFKLINVVNNVSYLHTILQSQCCFEAWHGHGWFVLHSRTEFGLPFIGWKNVPEEKGIHRIKQIHVCLWEKLVEIVGKPLYTVFILYCSSELRSSLPCGSKLSVFNFSTVQDQGRKIMSNVFSSKCLLCQQLSIQTDAVDTYSLPWERQHCPGSLFHVSWRRMIFLSTILATIRAIIYWRWHEMYN